MLSNRDLNINRQMCDGGKNQSTPIKNLTKTTRQLEEELENIERRIESRLHSIENGAQFRDSSVDVVHEFNQLKEDRFWRSEIETRLTEHLDELAARKLLRNEKLQSMKASTESSPAKRDAAYAQSLLENERNELRAARQRQDQDEISRVLAKCLHDEEERGKQQEETDSRTKSMIGRLLNKLRRVTSSTKK
jgi:hypothetical protein